MSLIKIDVEGHEGAVLGSMRDWMLEVKPGVVLFECWVGKDGFWSENAVTLLAGMGYELLAYDLRKYWSTKLYRVTMEMNNPAGRDFVAVHPGKLREDAARRLENMISSRS